MKLYTDVAESSREHIEHTAADDALGSKMMHLMAISRLLKGVSKFNSTFSLQGLLGQQIYKRTQKHCIFDLIKNIIALVKEEVYHAFKHI